MSEKNSRKTHSDKFPLTLHKTGQYCKKIKGKIYYFGNDKKLALEKYLEQETELYKGKVSVNNSGAKISIKTLCNMYLEYQLSRVNSRDLTERYYADQISLKMTKS